MKPERMERSSRKAHIEDHLRLMSLLAVLGFARRENTAIGVTFIK